MEGRDMATDARVGDRGGAVADITAKCFVGLDRIMLLEIATRLCNDEFSAVVHPFPETIESKKLAGK